MKYPFDMYYTAKRTHSESFFSINFEIVLSTAIFAMAKNNRKVTIIVTIGSDT